MQRGIELFTVDTIPTKSRYFWSLIIHTFWSPAISNQEHTSFQIFMEAAHYRFFLRVSIFFTRSGHKKKMLFNWWLVAWQNKCKTNWNSGGISHHYSFSYFPLWVSAVLWLFAHSSPFQRPPSPIRCWWRNRPHLATYCK